MKNAPDTTVDTLRNWFTSDAPTIEQALAEVDDARARGKISREEYLALLDAWPDCA